MSMAFSVIGRPGVVWDLLAALSAPLAVHAKAKAKPKAKPEKHHGSAQEGMAEPAEEGRSTSPAAAKDTPGSSRPTADKGDQEGEAPESGTRSAE